MITKEEYETALERIEELLPITSDEMPLDHPLIIELIKVSDLVIEYEKIHFPIEGIDNSIN